MMIDPGQPAFPELHIHHFFSEDAEDGKKVSLVPRWMGGLTKREYFAAMAMSALVIHREVLLDGCSTKLSAKVIAQMALAQADALIAALNKWKRNEPLEGTE